LAVRRLIRQGMGTGQAWSAPVCRRVTAASAKLFRGAV